MDEAAAKKKLLKPTWIGEKGRKVYPPPFALNQKAVGPPNKPRSYGVMEEVHHKIPLNPPLLKGETPIASLWQREVGRDLTRKFFTAKVIHSY